MHHSRRFTTPENGLVFLVIFVALSAMLQVTAHAAESEKRHQIESELANNEKALATAERQHNSADFKRLLCDDLIYVAFNGWVFTKSDLVSKMQYIDVERYDAENFKVRLPNSKTALITYDLKTKASIGSHDLPKKQYVSSLWVQRRGTWQLLFHQATPDTHP
ncbi:MAG: DUF4440 domain-containing protein [Terriglobales bacterium]